MIDIIERLRAKGLPPPEILQEAATEIERLRAALQSLTTDPPDDAEVIVNIVKMREIARRALEPKP